VHDAVKPVLALAGSYLHLDSRGAELLLAGPNRTQKRRPPSRLPPNAPFSEWGQTSRRPPAGRRDRGPADLQRPHCGDRHPVLPPARHPLPQQRSPPGRLPRASHQPPTGPRSHHGVGPLLTSKVGPLHVDIPTRRALVSQTVRRRGKRHEETTGPNDDRRAGG
jgi:hypothetical protein